MLFSRGAQRARLARANEALQKAQAELAHVARVMTMGELTASISNEVNQPIAAVVTYGQVCLRLLALETPRRDDVRATVERIVRDAHPASQVIQRIRALAKRTEPQMV
jgi:C4-dicarboxylate-specific signal transduction histidine kinase